MYLIIVINTVEKHVDFVETSMEIQMMSSTPQLECWSPLHMTLEQLGKWQAITPAVMGVALLAHSAPMNYQLEPNVT